MLLRLTQVFSHLSALPTISFWIVVARYLSAVLAAGEKRPLTQQFNKSLNVSDWSSLIGARS